MKLRLTTGGKTEELSYESPELLEAPYYRVRNGPSRRWRKEFEVDFHDKKVNGWAGIMHKGSHSVAGFSVFRRRRLIEGSVGETYKPAAIFGSPNSFAYQRVVGELFVEGFDVTHTKDGIQWHGYEDEILESIRRQIDSPSFPLLDQADGYRARKTADSLPTGFGADALTDTVDALTAAVTAGALDETTQYVSNDIAQNEPPISAPVLQHRELRLQIVRDGKPWMILLEYIRDVASPFYAAAIATKDGEEVLTVQLNLEHEFSISFINDNEAVLQPVVRIVAALAVSEHIARQSGLKHTGFLRQQANMILRALASHRGQP